MKTNIMRLLNNFKKLKCDKNAAGPNMGTLRALNPLPMPNPDYLQNREDIYKWIEYGVDCFREWYQPVDFGNGIAAHVTRPPNWLLQPDLLYANDVGISKWNYIVKKHIPEVKGKRVLDLGCSSGVYAIELARMGAKEVIGIDRNAKIRHRSTDAPPQQDVIAQANFVKKAFELLNGVKYPITYIAYDIGHLQELNLGRFDFILALNVIYHELDRMPGLVRQLAGMTDHLILQACEGHSGELGRWANKMRQVEVLLVSGFTNVEIDAPRDYLQPMVIGRKGLCARGE